MDERRLDCRGLAYPQPVLKTKELVDTGELAQLTVMVDNEAARDNVRQFLEHAGYRVIIWQEGVDFAVSGFRLTAVEVAEPLLEERAPKEKKILVVVGTDRLGRGDDELGQKLMASFLKTLKEMGRELWCLILLNAGVKLSVADSPVLGDLKELAAAGVQLLVSGTCLNHFHLLQHKEVGATTNMLDIVTHLQLADQVISLM